MNANIKGYLRICVFICGLLIVSLPAAIIITFVLSPLWSWIEATYGIESIGHSGPSDWCFVLVYSLLCAIMLGASLALRRRLSADKPG